jgi:uncharacterized membrane protein YfcA
VFILPKFYFMDFQIGLVIAGLIVGFIVGITGVGRGFLMTPILLWFGIPPTTAVGTDLLYALLVKWCGVHHKKIILMGNYRLFLWVFLRAGPCGYYIV